jgi:hypothetical protein
MVSSVTDLHRALAEIHSIRGQIARSAEFRGYGPATLAVTGLLALVAASVQSYRFNDPAHEIRSYLAIWVVTAGLSLMIIIIEALFRAPRVHSGLAMEMIHSALEQFIPAIVAGLLLTVVLFKCAQETLWTLPGLWQVLFSLGVFSSCRVLPRPMFAVGLWYLATGLSCLAFGGGDLAFSPWLMGIPFGVGQLLVALILQFEYAQADEEA